MSTQREYKGETRATSNRLKTVEAFFGEYMPLNYVVDPIIDAGGLYTLTGKTGSGKTALLTTLAMAIACNRPDLFRNTIEPGRVAYLTCENPRLFRMRLMGAFAELGIDPADIGNNLLVQDWFGTPEEMLQLLEHAQSDGPFKLIIVDTLASFFNGDNINDNSQAMTFLRALRPLTLLEGSPTVLIAAHPKKNAGDDDLIPYGGGAILNEVDGNLTMTKMSATRSTLHWQGKIRGIEFDPLTFELRTITCDKVRDAKGQMLPIPWMECCDPASAGDQEREDGDTTLRILTEIVANPGLLASELCARLNVSKSAMSKQLKKAEAKRWVSRNVRNGFTITKLGHKAILETTRDDPDAPL